MEIHLTGNMERYMWSFDGKKFTAVSDDPIRFAYNERVRVKLVNDTMMAHPIHLHGHFFELVNGAPADRQPQKHTVIVQPGGSATFDLTADEEGRSEEHTSELQSLMRISYAVFCLKKKNKSTMKITTN